MPEGGRSIRFPDWSKNNLLGSNQPRRYSHPALENTKMKSSPNLIASVSPVLEAIRTLPTLYFERASTSRSCSSGERKRGPARRWTCANLVWRAIFCLLSFLVYKSHQCFSGISYSVFEFCHFSAYIQFSSDPKCY